ncbi:MAG TPA: glycosyltransferase family 2 protein [Rhodocyclaceae bacterium]|nr:glycosyltransferase family 2 protein [Rhodocyclaceae bacterium]
MEELASLGMSGREARAHEAAIPLNLAHAEAPTPLRELPGGGHRHRVSLSVVVPVFNEAAVLPSLYARLAAVADSLGVDAEFLFVDDGSRDNTVAVLKGLKESDGRVAIVALSRNFGKEAALSAGLDHATGNAVVVMDADLQDPPELIPELLDRWREGYDVAYAQCISSPGEDLLRRLGAHLFYRLIHWSSSGASPVALPMGAGNFRIFSRRAVDALKQLKEQHRYMKGLFSWIGFRQIAVPYHRHPRLAGRSKFDYGKRWNLAVDGITSFTTAPLKVATVLGLIVSFVAFACVAQVMADALIEGNPVDGYPSLMSVVLFLGGVQLICLGVIGEYLGRLFNESKRRPLYLLDAHQPATSRRATLARQRKGHVP